jgi:putative addiction module component (TIGR02574 family)
MGTLEEVFKAAQVLPSDERAWLVEALWETLEPKDWPPLDAEWIAESQRRSEQLNSGQMTLASWTDVRNRVRRQAGLDG